MTGGGISSQGSVIIGALMSDPFFIFSYGLIQPPLRAIVLRTQPQRLAKFRRCRRIPSAARQRRAVVQMDIGEAGDEPRGLGKFAQRFAVPSQAGQRVAQFPKL